MKKKWAVACLLLLSILVIPLISAIEFEIKPVYDQGETLSSKFSGNFINPILPENIYFYRGHVRVPILYDIIKINDEYYIYALLSETQLVPNANYSIIIKDVRYYKGSQIIKDEIQRNFTISEKLADFSLNPGFIVTNKDFFVKVQNLQETKINIDISSKTILGADDLLIYQYDLTTNENKSIILNSGEIRKIDFSINDIKQTTFKTIFLDSLSTHYEIPVYIFRNKTDEIITASSKFRFNPVEMNFSSVLKDKQTKYIYLYNTGQTKLENIKLEVSEKLSPYIKLSAYEIDELEEGSEIKIEMYSESKKEVLADGYISAKTENNSITLPILINFKKDYVPTNDSNGGFDNGSGNVNPPIRNQTDGGDGNNFLTSFLSGKVIGWSIIIILVLLLIWFYFKKYRKAEKKIDLV